MSFIPKLEHRAAQQYVAVRTHLSREELADIVPQLLREVYEWLASHGIAAAGAPFVRYLVVDYNNAKLEIEVGAPVAAATVSGDERVQGGVLPGGRYATVLHRGPYTNLVATTAKLLAWGKENNIAWQVHEESNVTSWRGRIEHYLTGPDDEPDARNWQTEIAILLAEPQAE